MKFNIMKFQVIKYVNKEKIVCVYFMKYCYEEMILLQDFIFIILYHKDYNELSIFANI